MSDDEGMKTGGLTDESVCWGLHQATRELRDHWLKASENSRGGRRSSGNLNIASVGREMKPVSAHTGMEMHNGLLRDADMDEPGPANWVPYAHFGI